MCHHPDTDTPASRACSECTPRGSPSYRSGCCGCMSHPPCKIPRSCPGYPHRPCLPHTRGRRCNLRRGIRSRAFRGCNHPGCRRRSHSSCLPVCRRFRRGMRTRLDRARMMPAGTFPPRTRARRHSLSRRTRHRDTRNLPGQPRNLPVGRVPRCKPAPPRSFDPRGRSTPRCPWCTRWEHRFRSSDHRRAPPHIQSSRCTRTRLDRARNRSHRICFEHTSRLHHSYDRGCNRTPERRAHTRAARNARYRSRKSTPGHRYRRQHHRRSRARLLHRRATRRRQRRNRAADHRPITHRSYRRDSRNPARRASRPPRSCWPCTSGQRHSCHHRGIRNPFDQAHSHRFGPNKRIRTTW